MSSEAPGGQKVKWWIPIARFINAMHIYSSYKESLVKTLVFIASWAISVFCYYQDSESSVNTEVSTMLGGAVVLFSISILLEVIDRMGNDDPVPRRLLTGVTVISSAVCMCFGAVEIFSSTVSMDANPLIIICSVPVIIYVLDAITHMLIPDLNIFDLQINPEQRMKTIELCK